MENSNQYQILVIEDQDHHMDDAQRIGNKLEWCRIEYATNYEEANACISQKIYDGIVSDVFFPAHDRQDVRCMNAPKGWDYDLALSLECILQPHFKKYIPEIQPHTYKPETQREIEDEINAYKDALSWRTLSNSHRDREGKIKPMHPTGVLVAEYALTQRIPFVFCTDGYHHSIALNPICVYYYNRKKEPSAKIEFVDCYNEDNIEAHAPHKNWTNAYDKLLQFLTRGAQ